MGAWCSGNKVHSRSRCDLPMGWPRVRRRRGALAWETIRETRWASNVRRTGEEAI